MIEKDITAIDDAIHDLLMKRVDLMMKAGHDAMVSSGSEAKLIRRLLDRHEGPLQKAAVVRIWRELVGAVSFLQTNMKVSLGSNLQEYTDMARDYFGSVVPMHHVANPTMAISMVREGDINFAVLPWPEDEAENPWWSYLEGNDSDKTVRVVARLPYGDWEQGRGNPVFRALVVTRMNFNESGMDHSFLLLDLDQAVSRARVVDKMKMLEITALSIYSRRVRGISDRSLHLVEVDSYIGNDDPRLQQILDRLENPEGKCMVVGGYPVLRLLPESGKKST